MSEELWQFVDGLANASSSTASELIERWVREKREAVSKVAA
jgi:hypothetical protein